MEKKNQIPKYPHLRFSEFTDEWKEYQNSEVFEIISEKNTDLRYSNVVSASMNHGVVLRDEIGIDIKYEQENIRGYKVVRDGDYIVHLRSFQGGFAFSRLNGICSPAYTILRPQPNMLEYGFLESYFYSSRFITSLKQVTYGIRDGRSISIGEWMQEKTSLPTLPEQRKIAALLSLIDERIEVQNAISNDLESLIVGFYNSVQYVTKAGWHKVRLRDLLTIRKEQNTSGSYEVYSVSVSRGIVNQIVHLGRSFAAANTSNYGVVHPGDLVYTKSPTGQFPFGIVKQNHNASPVAVSPLYGVYRPISPEVGTLLHYFFLSPLRANNYLAPLIQKGAKNTINIRTDHFLDNVVLLPKDEKELRCIADCLLALDERLSVEREYVELLKQQKAYLLRQMFI